MSVGIKYQLNSNNCWYNKNSQLDIMFFPMEEHSTTCQVVKLYAKHKTKRNRT
jgi:hypothetical protein